MTISRSNQRYRFLEQRIDELLNNRQSPEQVEKTAREMDPKFLPYVTSIYLEQHGTNDEAQIFRTLNKLLYRQKNKDPDENCLLMKYKQGILAIYHFQQFEPQTTRYSSQLVNLAGSDLTHCRIGVCGSCHTLDELDLCIQKSFYALRIAKLRNVDMEYYQRIGIYAFIIPLSENKSAREYYAGIYNIITDYDNRYNSSLMETLTCYVDREGQIAAVAETLYQHQNTVRYRLQKAKMLLGLDSDFQLREVMDIVIRLQRLLIQEASELQSN